MGIDAKLEKEPTLGRCAREIVRTGDAALPPSRLVRGPNGLLVMPSGQKGKKITQEAVNKAREEGYFG